MRPSFRSLSSFAASLLVLLALASTASAQTTVSVLGLTSLEGDDEFARNFTGALRHAASQVEGWTVSDRDVALSQMELTHDCSSSDSACMMQIAESIGSSRVIYGTIQRAPIGARFEFQVTLFLFDTATGQVEERFTDNVPSSDTDIDALREPAREMVRALSAATSPGTIRVTGTPNSEVRIDGTVVGRTDAGGTYVSDPVPPGAHTVRLGDAEESVTIAGNEALAAFTVAEGGGGGGSVLPWVGIGMLGVAAVSLGVSIFAMAQLDSLSNNPDYVAYRRSVGAMDPMATTVCDSRYYSTAAFGSVGQSTCGDGGTMEILQYVFLGVAVAAGGAGIALIAVGAGEGGGTADSANLGNGMRLRLSPSVSPERAYLGATLEF